MLYHMTLDPKNTSKYADEDIIYLYLMMSSSKDMLQIEIKERGIQTKLRKISNDIQDRINQTKGH